MLIILYAFIGIVLTYPIVLLIWLYSLFWGFVFFKLNKNFIRGDIMKKLLTALKYFFLALGLLFLEQLPLAFIAADQQPFWQSVLL